ncbi:MAG: hypothetical protein J6B51_05825 [Clostridia bacterium]|nr:hypothetical protein [Clostridia bacterium]MBO5299582.1 hypothetical protein [Clostridia bacterium]
MKRKIEYKKVAFALVCIFALAYISVGRIFSICGISVDPSTDTALIYVVLGAYAAYCTASAVDKHNISKYGYLHNNHENNIEEGDGTE